MCEQLDVRESITVCDICQVTYLSQGSSRSPPPQNHGGHQQLTSLQVDSSTLSVSRSPAAGAGSYSISGILGIPSSAVNNSAQHQQHLVQQAESDANANLSMKRKRKTSLNFIKKSHTCVSKSKPKPLKTVSRFSTKWPLINYYILDQLRKECISTLVILPKLELMLVSG